MGIKLHEMSVTFEPLCFPALRRKTTVQILILILMFLGPAGREVVSGGVGLPTAGRGAGGQDGHRVRRDRRQRGVPPGRRLRRDGQRRRGAAGPGVGDRAEPTALDRLCAGQTGPRRRRQ